MSAAYEKYLQSSHWLMLRKKRCGPTAHCVGCGTKKHLQLHHVSYARVGWERPNDLIVVCRACHERIHAELDRQFPGKDLASKVTKTVDIWLTLFPDGGHPTISRALKAQIIQAENIRKKQARRDAELDRRNAEAAVRHEMNQLRKEQRAADMARPPDRAKIKSPGLTMKQIIAARRAT